MKYFVATLTGLAVTLSLVTPAKAQTKAYKFDSNEAIFIQSVNEYLARDGATLRIEPNAYSLTIEMGRDNCQFLDKGHSISDILDTYKQAAVEESHDNEQAQFDLESMAIGTLGASINHLCSRHAGKLSEINHWIDGQSNDAYL